MNFTNSLVSLTLLSASLAQANLIAYWPFDDLNGEVAEDIIGGYNGILNGGTWLEPGKVGAGALEGAGGNEVLCPAEAISTTEDLTLAWWMIDNQSSWGTIMDKSFTDSTSGFDILVRPTGTEDSPLRFRIGGWQAYGGWGTECRLPAGAYEDGEWVHIVCVYDSATDTASIYVNGKLPENGTLNPKTGIAGEGGYCEGVNNTTAPLYLRGGKETFTGILDDVAMWDRALSPEEIVTVFTSGPLAVERPAKELAITSFDLSEITNEFTLTWNSNIGELYAVKYSTDLTNWDADLDDGILADEGDTTSRTFKLTDLDNPKALHFRVEKQEE